MNRTPALINAGTAQRAASAGAVRIPLGRNPSVLQRGEAPGGGLKGKAGAWQALGRHSRKRAVWEKLPERKRPLGVSGLESNSEHG